MRFLLDFVPCWGSQELGRSEDEELPRVVDETSSLVPATTRVSRHRKRSIGGGGRPAEWKPSLTAISEDRAVGAAPKKAAGERPAKRKSGSAWSLSRFHSDNLGRTPLETGIPAFAPTPFMF